MKRPIPQNPRPEGDRTRDAIMDAIEDWWRQYGYAPTVRELAVAVDRSVPVTHAHLEVLAAGQMVTWTPGVARTIRKVPCPT